MNIRYLVFFLIFFSSTLRAEEQCLKSVQSPKEYSSFWVEDFYLSGRFSGILDEKRLIDKQSEISKKISLANERIKALMIKGVPDGAIEQESYMREFFALKDSLKGYRDESPYYARNMETTEKLLIYKFALVANSTVKQEIKELGDCLGKEAYIERVMGKTESLFRELSNKRL